MTPTQQAALEALVGRPLTAPELALVDIRDDLSLAASLSVGQTRVVSTQIGIGTVLAVMAPNGGAFLDSLAAIGASDANVKWALEMIKNGTFDVGHPVTRAQIQAFAAAQPSMASALDDLLAVAVQPDPISTSVVSEILNGA